MRQDEDFQSSITQLQGEWFGFGTPRHMIDYTVCQAIDGVIIESTCKNVGQNSSGTLAGLRMDYFTVSFSDLKAMPSIAILYHAYRVKGKCTQ